MTLMKRCYKKLHQINIKLAKFKGHNNVSIKRILSQISIIFDFKILHIGDPHNISTFR